MAEQSRLEALMVAAASLADHACPCTVVMLSLFSEPRRYVASAAGLYEEAADTPEKAMAKLAIELIGRLESKLSASESATSRRSAEVRCAIAAADAVIDSATPRAKEPASDPP